MPQVLIAAFYVSLQCLTPQNIKHDQVTLYLSAITCEFGFSVSHVPARLGRNGCGYAVGKSVTLNESGRDFYYDCLPCGN